LQNELNSSSTARRHGHRFLLDKMGRNGFDIEETKYITAEEVEFLLSEPVITFDRARAQKLPRLCRVTFVSNTVSFEARRRALQINGLQVS